MGYVQTVHGQHSVCRSCRKDAQEMVHMHTYTVKGVYLASENHNTKTQLTQKPS